MSEQEQPNITDNNSSSSDEVNAEDKQTPDAPAAQVANAASSPAKPTQKKRVRNRRAKKAVKKPAPATVAAKRTPRPYPASSFEEALPLAEAIHQYASGEKVRRLTLLIAISNGIEPQQE